MSFSFPSSLQNALKSASPSLDWAMKIYYDAEGANDFIGVSSKDRAIQSVQYYGVVKSWGEVVNEIDLSVSESYLAGFSIECLNVWKQHKFSEILFGSTNFYINHKALLYFGEDDETTLANWALLGEYRLTNINHNFETVTLEFEERLPWDKLKIPQEKSSNYKRKYYPVVMGDFTEETSTPASPQFCDSAVVFPIPINHVYYETVTGLAYDNIATGVSMKFHFWNPSLEVYIPVDTTNTTQADTSTPDNNGRYIAAPGDLRHGAKFYPIGEGASNDWANPLNCLNASNLNWAQKNLSALGGSTDYYFLALQMPSIEFPLQAFTVRIQWAIDITLNAGTPAYEIDLHDVTYNADGSTPDPGDSTSNPIDLGGSGTHGGFTDADGNQSTAFAAANYSLIGANYYGAGNKIPTELKLCLKTAVSNGAADLDVHIRIYTLTVEYTGALAETDVVKEFNQLTAFYMNEIKFLYSGINGVNNAWDSALITEPQQMHREILQTHAGLASGDIDGGGSGSWDDLDTDKNGMTARFWEVEPRPVKEILNQLQFEGGFVALWSQQKVKYVYVKNSYSSADVTLTEKDYEGIEFGLTPFSDIVTQRTYRYNRHAAEDYLQDTAEVSEVYNVNARSDWNFDTSENIEEIDLRYLVAGVSGGANINSSIGNYYAKILEDPKVLASCRIINPQYFTLEIGDTIIFNDTNIDAFNKTMASTYFMVVSTRRTVSELFITAREVS